MSIILKTKLYLLTLFKNVIKNIYSTGIEVILGMVIKYFIFVILYIRLCSYCPEICIDILS